MSLLVAMTGWETAPWIQRFRTLLPDRKVVTVGEPFDRREVRYAAAWRHPAGSLSGLPNLAAVFWLGAGVDYLMSDQRLPDVPLVRVVNPDLTHRMSEYIALHALMHLRQQRRYDRQQRQRIWRDDRSQPAAKDVRVGVMGLGALGQDAAHLLKTIGFDVAGWSRSSKERPGITTYYGQQHLNAFLARTDILVCLLPLTQETRGILNHSLFLKLARGGRLGGPSLINAGRGGLQVDADILASLESGVLKEATLDVFEEEPLADRSPLWEHPAVTITPHNAAVSDPDSISFMISEQIKAFEAGRGLQHLVDRQSGY